MTNRTEMTSQNTRSKIIDRASSAAGGDGPRAKPDTVPPPSESRKRLIAVRILVGAILLFSAANHLFGLAPPPPLTGAAARLWQALAPSDVFVPILPIMKAVEFVAGVLLLSGWAVPLALAALAPVIANIAGFHLAVAPQGIPIAVVLVACWGILAHGYRNAFRPLLSMRAASGSPSTGGAGSGRRRTLEIVVGLVFLASALSAALGKTPPPSTAAAAAVMQGLEASKYFIPMLIGTQFVAGLMLTAGRFVPMALIALAPIVVEILAYRSIARGAATLTISLGLLAAEAWLVWQHRMAFAPLVRRRRDSPPPRTFRMDGPPPRHA